jgi:citrate lyase subunit beta-like protein
MISHPRRLCRTCTLSTSRKLSTNAVPAVRLRRAMLYVPGSNPRMLEKSFASPADSICYDLEDAVAPGKKVEARRMVCELLDVSILLYDWG